MNGYKVIISVIIVNYNLEKEISDCLKNLISTFKQVSKFSDAFEVIIVDNNSPNKKLPELEKEFRSDKIHFIYSKTNLGFGKGCNLGTSEAKGKYFLFLNPDTIVSEDIFTPIINLLEEDESIGIIGPQQQTRKPFFDFSAGFSPNLFFEFFNLFGLGVFAEGFFISVLSKFSSKKYFDVNWILGASIFIKKELFEMLNGFDKDYFMFFEELDLCRRVKLKGFRVVYFHKLKIHHIGSVSGKKNYFLYTVRTYASKYLYISKHFRGLKKKLMIVLLYLQLFSQMIIWSLLSPFSFDKSKQKIKSFIYLIKHRFRNEIDIK